MGPSAEAILFHPIFSYGDVLTVWSAPSWFKKSPLSLWWFLYLLGAKTSVPNITANSHSNFHADAPQLRLDSHEMKVSSVKFNGD